MSLPNKLVLMYHSVSGPTPAVIGSVPVSLVHFQRQIALLRRLGYTFCTLDELAQTPEGRQVAITADDGTVDWVENVLPYCEAEGIPTLTAVMTGVGGSAGMAFGPCASGGIGAA